MSPDRVIACEYLRPPPGAPWAWAEQGTVITWRDGTTLAFREEIRQVLETLGPSSLPPFGAVVLLLAALRGRLPQLSDFPTCTQPPLPGLTPDPLAAERSALMSALDQLGRLSRWPGEVHSGARAKGVLATAVFETAVREPLNLTPRILAGFPTEPTAPELEAHQAGNAEGTLLQHVHLVARGLRSQTAEGLALRLRTGLDTLPDAAPVPPLPEVSPTDRARRWLEELSPDAELGAVARAAKDLLAAVRLPRRLVTREALSAGGSADIASRGSLDRLLLSELAQDDLTLAVRVALNEALYLQPEPPQREPPQGLAILLDAGLRTWGVPRILGTASALALLAGNDCGPSVRVWRASSRGLTAVDLLTREGLTQHLSALEVTVHPGAALADFQRQTETQPGSRVVIVTEADVLEDPEFRTQLAALSGLEGWVASLDREGQFALHALPLLRRPPACIAQLDLHRILHQDRPKSPTATTTETDLPACFRSAAFPFLLPIAGRMTAWSKAGQGAFLAVLADRRLMLFTTPDRGGECLLANLPPGKVMWLGTSEHRIHVVKVPSSNRPARLTTIHEDTGESWTVGLCELTEDAPSVAALGDVLLFYGSHQIWAYSSIDGGLLARHSPETPGLRHLHGRYYRTASGALLAATWDGSELRLDPLPLPPGWQAGDVQTVFDREGVPGPWVARCDGIIRSLGSGEELHLKLESGAKGKGLNLLISRDGHRGLWCVPISLPWLFTLNPVSVTQLAHRPTAGGVDILDPPPKLPSRNIFRVVSAVGLREGQLAVEGRQSVWRQFTTERPLRLQGHFGAVPSTHSLPTTGVWQPVPGGAALERLEWPSGNVAWVDSRGLLHLRSHDPAVAEVSLVLADGEIAGWTSHGPVCGPDFFFRPGKKSTDEGAVRAALEAFVHTL